MTLTEKEEALLRRALCKASVDVEAEKAAQALIRLMRKRGASAYDIPRQAAPPPPKSAGVDVNSPEEQAKRAASRKAWADQHVPPKPSPSPKVDTKVGSVLCFFTVVAALIILPIFTAVVSAFHLGPLPIPTLQELVAGAHTSAASAQPGQSAPR